MITVNSELLTDLSTRQEIIIRDINGQIIASQTIVNNFGFDFAKVFEGDDGLTNWRLYSEAEEYRRIRADILASHRANHNALLDQALAAGHDSMDIFFNRGGQFTALKLATDWIAVYKNV